MFGNKINIDNTPLPIRSSTMDVKDLFYSIRLLWRHQWLWGRSNELDETIVKILRPVNGGKRLFARLIHKFMYVGRSESNKCISMIAEQIKGVWKCDKNQTLIMAVKLKKNRHPDGSSKMLYDLQTALKDWNDRYIIDPFNDKDIRLASGFNVVLCDDFIGSGSTIDKRIKSLKAVMPASAKIYVVSLAAMKESVPRYISSYNNVAVFSPIWLEKGIKDGTSIAIMLEMEKRLAPKYKGESLENCSLGYGKAGGLYYNEDYRIPNNVYPIFWWGLLVNGQRFKSLFERP